MRHPLLLLLLAAACSEYDLKGEGEDPNPFDSGDTPPEDTAVDSDTPPDEPECPELSAEPRTVPLNEECSVEIQTGTFTPVVEWEISGHNAYGPPIVGNLDDDDGDGVIGEGDTPDILIVQNSGAGLIALDGATGAIKWTSRAVTDGLSQVAIGDVDGDGVPEIAASNGPSTVVLLDNRGALRWSTAVDTSAGGTQLYSALNPAIADMDGDGYAEIVAGKTILGHDGSVVGVGSFGVGACPNNSNSSYLEGSVAVPVDIDLDGELEVVVGNAIYDMYGRTLYSTGDRDGTVAVADFDLDGYPEYAVSSGNRVATYETDLTPTGWAQTFSGTNYVGPIAADDLDGDGTPDFVVVASGEMRAFRWDGSTLWSRPVSDSSGAAGPVLFDFENDGYPEVVYADERTIHVFNGLDGSIKLESGDHQSATLFETPVVADVDGDGEVEIIMSHGQGGVGLTVYGDRDHSWPSGRPLWNQHAYTITNVEDDGGIPRAAVPNWTVYNNFRSGDAGLPPNTWNDLVPEIVETCVDECPDRLHLLVRVWNQGTEEVPAGLNLAVRAGYDGPVVATATVSTSIASGYSTAGIPFEIAAADLGGAEPVVDVDRSATSEEAVAECREDNNQVVVDEACP